ncbi:MAG: hypothetical protein IJC51_03870 [Eggerthellaceae bacterium]|nr:hypothetical protein [Eggerthellaceae bacterium]
MLDIKRVLASAPKAHEKGETQSLLTPWGEAVDAESVLREYPRPQLARIRYGVLNGWWDYAVVQVEDSRNAWHEAVLPEDFDGRILVPFTPKTLLSGVDRQVMPNELLWYRRVVDVPAFAEGERCILHFQAVDWACSCYVNGTKVGEHVGGYLPFSFDVTDALRAGDTMEIALCVFDPSDEGSQLRGKQKIGGTGIWYEAQAGIWQTVWYEVVPEAHVMALRIDADMRGNLLASVDVSDAGSQGLTLRVLDAEGAEVAREEVKPLAASGGTATISVSLNVPCVRVWSCEDPYLYDIEVTYGRDVVTSYCGFRSVCVKEDERGIARVFLNDRPIFLKGVLDQGYWSDGLMTAPADEALTYDVEAMKSLGFNMLRKHIKVESERWY